MASDEIIEDDTTSIADATSDYGSDLDNEAWDTAFSQAETQPLNIDVDEGEEEPVLPDDVPEHRPRSLRLARVRENIDKTVGGVDNASAVRLGVARADPNPVQITYDEGNGKDLSSASQIDQDERNGTASVDPDAIPDTAVPELVPAADPRSPLERFRIPPKKPLSVTDIVSPAWCERQYWYSLTKYGRVRRTPAMKAGSKIHKEKEQEVHTEVPVEIVTNEDRLGLRLWNIIHGLRTLRSTGLTRELEVLGVVNGEVVIGIIDEITYACPNEAEEAVILHQAEAGKSKGKKTSALPPDQRTMAEFFAHSQSASTLENHSPWLGTLRDKPRTLYIVDIKTRASQTLPRLGSQMRPTQMQLMLYHRLLTNLASNQIEAERVFERYGVNHDMPFSDTFVANLANIDFSSSQASGSLNEGDLTSGSQVSSQQDALDEILTHNTLASLWALMIAEFAKTIDITAKPPSISPLLTAEFRASSTGDLIGKRCFAFDAETLDIYVEDVMHWWRGERQPRGVEVEEAYKCRICEFAEICEWRAEKIEEATMKARGRRAKADQMKTAE